MKQDKTTSKINLEKPIEECNKTLGLVEEKNQELVDFFRKIRKEYVDPLLDQIPPNRFTEKKVIDTKNNEILVLEAIRLFGEIGGEYPLILMIVNYRGKREIYHFYKDHYHSVKYPIIPHYKGLPMMIPVTDKIFMEYCIEIIQALKRIFEKSAKQRYSGG